MSSRKVVEAYFAYWAAQDVEMTTSLFHPSIIYKMHVDSADRPFGGEWRGVDACRHTMFSILEEFDYLKYEPVILGVKGGVVRTQIGFKYSHRRTGGILEGRRRLVFKVKGGLIVRIDGYHDAKLVEAFMKLTEHRIANNQVAETPALPKRVKQGSA